MYIWKNNWFTEFRISSLGDLNNHMMLACYRITSSYLSVVNMKRIRFLGTLRARRKSKLIFTSLLYFSNHLLVTVQAQCKAAAGTARCAILRHAWWLRSLVAFTSAGERMATARSNGSRT